MSVFEDFDEIIEHTHFWNWAPGRNRVLHGHVHPRFWSEESFEQLIHEIAELSKFSNF